MKANRKTSIESRLAEKMKPHGYRLKKSGKEVILVPWAGTGPAPWGAGYAHVSIDGHEQIVRIENLERF